MSIEKTLYDKAREKFKENRNNVEEDMNEDDANDYLKPFLEKRGLSSSSPVHDYSVASDIKN